MDTSELISKLRTLAYEARENHPDVACILLSTCAGLADNAPGLESIVLAAAKASYDYVEKCNRQN